MMVERGYSTAKKVIEEHRDALITMAELLLEREVLDGAEVLQIVQGKTLPSVPKKNQPNKPEDGQTQQVLRPEGGRRLPGLSEGERPQPA
jgi:cell division protease FtsH